MLVSEKGTMGVGSSSVRREQCVLDGIASPYVPFINIAPIVGGTNGIHQFSDHGRVTGALG